MAETPERVLYKLRRAISPKAIPFYRPWCSTRKVLETYRECEETITALQQRLEAAERELEQWRAESAAKDKRIRLLEHLLRQGRSILSNPALIKIQGNLPGQVVFGDWSAKVDEAVPENAPAPKEESV